MALTTGFTNYLSLNSAPTAGNTVHTNVRFSPPAGTPWSAIYYVSGAHIGRANMTGTPLYASDRSGTDFLGSQVIGNNIWYALTWSWDGTTDKVYVNGDLEISTTGMNFVTSRAITTIGSYGTASNNGENTFFDGVKVWQAVLTQQEIRNEVGSIKPKRFQDLWAWLPCNNGSVVGADYSGSSRSFTQSGTVAESAPSSTAWGDSHMLIPQANTGLIYRQSPLMLSAC